LRVGRLHRVFYFIRRPGDYVATALGLQICRIRGLLVLCVLPAARRADLIERAFCSSFNES